VPEEDKGKLILPYGVSGKPAVGIVVKVGADLALDLQTGDRVFYHDGHGVEIEDVKVVGEDCVIAYDDSMRAF
jgi:co-chaperonin GroES (HSP10)